MSSGTPKAAHPTDPAAPDERASTSHIPDIAAGNGSDRSAWMEDPAFGAPAHADSRARLLQRIMIAERERAEGSSVDAFEATASLRELHGM